MNLLVKQASSYTSDELSLMGVSGIPSDWPLESCEDMGQDIPDGFTQMSDSDMISLKVTNQTAYNAWLESKQDPLAIARRKVKNAIAFGQDLIIEFSAESGTWNLNTLQIISLATELAPVQMLLQSGALGTAIMALNSITPDEIMTPEIIEKYTNTIQNYIDTSGD